MRGGCKRQRWALPAVYRTSSMARGMVSMTQMPATTHAAREARPGVSARARRETPGLPKSALYAVRGRAQAARAGDRRGRAQM